MSEQGNNNGEARNSTPRRNGATSQRDYSRARVNVGRASITSESATDAASQSQRRDGGTSQRRSSSGQQRQNGSNSQRGSSSRSGGSSSRGGGSSRSSSRSSTQRGSSLRGSSQRSSSGASARRDSAPSFSEQRIMVGRPSDGEVLRNRIIAIAILVVVVIVLVNLVMCAARGIGGSGEESSSSSSANAVASEQASSASAAVGSGEGVEDPWVESGRFSTGDAELDQLVKNFCDGLSKPELSAEDNAFNAYCQGMWAEFIERDNNQEPMGTSWDITYAKQILTQGGGNCYEQVALGEFILKYFGYEDVYAEPCFILRQSGEYGDHGLLYVTDKDGRKCLCDPAFGANGWMLDADTYTVQLMDIGQDPDEFTIAPFEKVVKAPWNGA